MEEEKSRGPQPEGTIPVTMDISGMYTNIPWQEGTDALNQRVCKAVPTVFLITLLCLVLSYNLFTFVTFFYIISPNFLGCNGNQGDSYFFQSFHGLAWEEDNARLERTSPLSMATLHRRFHLPMEMFQIRVFRVCEILNWIPPNH